MVVRAPGVPDPGADSVQASGAREIRPQTQRSDGVSPQGRVHNKGNIGMHRGLVWACTRAPEFWSSGPPGSLLRRRKSSRSELEWFIKALG